jgi:hypothetical protein
VIRDKPNENRCLSPSPSRGRAVRGRARLPPCWGRFLGVCCSFLLLETVQRRLVSVRDRSSLRLQVVGQQT